MLEHRQSESRPVSEAGRRTLLDMPLQLPVAWLLVGAIVLLQWATFVAFATREVTWAYPGYFDQTAYLALSYRAFEQMLKDGLLSGLWSSLTARVPQETLLHPQAALLYLLRGPSRLSALTLNWLYVIFLECALVYTLRRLTRRWSVAFIGLGLLLATTSRFAGAGGMTDFRADLGSLCLYGVFLCAVICSGVFKSVRWAIVVGISIAWLVLFRHLTALSIALVLFLVLVFIGMRAFSRRRSSPERTAWRARVNGIVVSGLVALLLAAPTLWTKHDAILNYYGQITHTDEGKIRIEEFGVGNTADFLLFYPRSLLNDHLGAACRFAIALIAIVTLPLLLRTPRRAWHSLPLLPVDSGAAVFFMAAALVGPLLVLSAFPSRSPVVGGFLVPPVIGIVMAMVVAFARAGHGRASTNIMLGFLSTVVLSTGIYTELSASTQKAMYAEHKDDMKQLGELYDEIGLRSRRWGLTVPKVAFDRIHDYLHLGILESWFYERHGALIYPSAALRGSILPVTLDEALAAIKACDFAVLTDPSSPDDPGFPYPFNQSMKEIYPAVRDAAEQELSPIRRFETYSQHLTLYMRVPLRVEGDSGGWITSDGLVVIGPGELLQQYRRIEVRGRSILHEHFKGSLGVSAQIQSPGQPARTVSASITPPGPEYTLVINLEGAQIPADQDVRVKILFDKFVVPKEVGFNEDERRLVIMTPTQLRAAR